MSRSLEERARELTERVNLEIRFQCAEWLGRLLSRWKRIKR